MSIYIHIPFCNSICSYCDFCKIFYDKKYIKSYLDNLRNEIVDRYKGEEVNTIYIGGGTPSCLEDDELVMLFDIIKVFNLSNDYEFTIEGNVESITESKLNIMKKYGVNRISIGVQSFDNDVIKLLGRRHTEKEVFDKINLIKRYIDNVNIDIIYAAYNDINILKRDIDKALKLDVKHISTYSLILEDNTLLKVNGFNGIDEDLDYEMYKYIEDILEDNGYVHYEISNYAKKGYESRHNLVYWNNDNYYGFGLSSTSYINGVRRVNTKNLAKYLDGEYMGSVEEESIDIRMENEVMLGLRKFNGINLNSFKNTFDTYYKGKFEVVPRLYEEALVQVLSKSSDEEVAGYQIPQDVIENYQDYIHCKSGRKAKEELRERYSSTYWYYSDYIH